MSITGGSIASRSLVCLLVMALLAFLSPTAGAASTIPWDGGAGTNNMDTAANWNPDTAVPSATLQDTAQWDGTVPGDLSLTYTAAGTGANLAGGSGLQLNVTAAHTGSVTINEASGTVGMRIQNITIANGAGAFK